jgi:hypothetical protein
MFHARRCSSSLAFAIAACFSPDSGDGDQGSSDTGSSSGGETSSSGVVTTTSSSGAETLSADSTDGPPVCAEIDLGMVGPATHEGSNTMAADAQQPTCSDPDGRDVTLQWTAPSAGLWRISTFGSSYDTVLMVFDGCGGADLGCNDDATVFGDSVVDVTAEAGQQFIIVLDGFDADATGDYVLNIADVVCTEVDIGAVAPTTHMGSTVGESDDMYSDCGGVTTPDEELLWTAPLDSNYLFSTEGSDFDTLLAIHEGGCGTPVWRCNNDGMLGAVPSPSRVVAALTADQSVLVVVDGETEQGAYTLQITDLGPFAGDCCTVHPELGCNIAGTAECVCAQVPECCVSGWSQVCVGVLNDECGGRCPTTPGGTCCLPDGQIGCDVPTIQDCTCGILPDCCASGWTADCVSTAETFCAAAC